MSILINLPSDHPFLAFEHVETEHDFLVYCMFKEIFLNDKPVSHYILEQSVVYAIPKILFLNADEEIVDEARKRAVPAILNHFIDAVNRDSIKTRNDYILFDGKQIFWERIPVFISMFVNKFKFLKVFIAVNDTHLKIKVLPNPDMKVTNVVGGLVPVIDGVKMSAEKEELEKMCLQITEQYDSLKANDVLKSYVFSMFGNWFSNPPVKAPVDNGIKKLDLRSLLSGK